MPYTGFDHGAEALAAPRRGRLGLRVCPLQRSKLRTYAVDRRYPARWLGMPLAIEMMFYRALTRVSPPICRWVDQGEMCERGRMFIQCANGACSTAFHYTHGAMAFRVETRFGEPYPNMDLSVEYHWLCPECLHIILVSWLDHCEVWPKGGPESAGKTVHLISLDTALSDMWKSSWEADWLGGRPGELVSTEVLPERHRAVYHGEH